MVQGGLCVISHNLGEETTPRYLRAMETYQHVLRPMVHELDLEMCGRKSELAQAVPAPVLCSNDVDVTKLSYFGPFVPATVLSIPG